MAKEEIKEACRRLMLSDYDGYRDDFIHILRAEGMEDACFSDDFRSIIMDSLLELCQEEGIFLMAPGVEGVVYTEATFGMSRDPGEIVAWRRTNRETEHKALLTIWYNDSLTDYDKDIEITRLKEYYESERAKWRNH